jgi:hypothetical protein
MVGIGKDPFAITSEMNLDLSQVGSDLRLCLSAACLRACYLPIPFVVTFLQFVKELSFKLEFAHKLAAFLGTLPCHFLPVAGL